MLTLEELPNFLKAEFSKKRIKHGNIPERLNINSIYNKSMVEELRTWAKSKNGLLISEYYLGDNHKLEWQCENNHRWWAVPSSIKQEHWCPICAGTRRGTIEEMQKIAEGRGGQCLSKEYINNHSKLVWQCKDGHQWEASPNKVKHETWCPSCAGVKKGTIEEMQEIALRYGGKCQSPIYISAHSKLKWKCKEGHRWEAAPAKIKWGQWCPTCGGTQKGTIKKMREMAEDRGGKCLSKEYINNHSKLTWLCKEGHRWEAVPGNIQQGKWCPVCARKR